MKQLLCIMALTCCLTSLPITANAQVTSLRYMDGEYSIVTNRGVSAYYWTPDGTDVGETILGTQKLREGGLDVLLIGYSLGYSGPPAFWVEGVYTNGTPYLEYFSDNFISDFYTEPTTGNGQVSPEVWRFRWNTGGTEGMGGTINVHPDWTEHHWSEFTYYDWVVIRWWYFKNGVDVV